jgi:hypothetical protein
MPRTDEETEGEYIRRIMKAHPRELGFIPIDPDHPPTGLKWIHNRHGETVGFLIHGPARPGAYTRIYELVVEAPWRRERRGTDTFDQLRAVAIENETPWITLRCADDLEAVEFWKFVGAFPLCTRPGGRTTKRTLIEFAALTHPHLRELAPLPPQPPRRLITTTTPLAVLPSQHKITTTADCKLTLPPNPQTSPNKTLAITHRNAPALALALNVRSRPKK